jgi:hypothetical protein
LGADDLFMRLSLEKGASDLDLALEAKGGDMGLDACLRLQDGAAGPLFIAGPGSVSGLARLFQDPTSPTPLSTEQCVELDRSFESRSPVLGLSAGPLSLFAVGEGRGLERELQTAAAGLALDFPLAPCELSALAAASFPIPPSEASGWKPDPYASPALAACDPRRPCLDAAIVARDSSGNDSVLAAFAASYSELSGPGLAIRLESNEALGPLNFRCSASASGTGFEDLEGERQERLLDIHAEAELLLRLAATLGASTEIWAQGQGLLYAPLWEGKGALDLVLPLGAESTMKSEIELEMPLASSSAALVPRIGGSKGGGCSLCFAHEAELEGAKSSASLVLDASWDEAFAGTGLKLSTELAGLRGLPALGLDLGLEGLARASLESPVLATGDARLRLPFGRGAFLELEASLPDAGLVLAPSVTGSPRPEPLFRLRYRAWLSESSARSRPRSRSSGRPKERSIAQRAAS